MEKTYSQNDFGNMAHVYNTTRRGYGDEVYPYIKFLLKTKSIKTLDLGCGTGISTRELQQHGFNVIGLDKDESMIAVAEEHGSDIAYIISGVNKLPFEDETFDVVTAFTAFHWFNNEESLKEIRRILKPNGLFVSVLKGNQQDEESKNFRDEYMNILAKYAGPKFDTTQNHFDHEAMTKIGFKDLSETSFLLDEYYSVSDALLLMKSLSIWNLVPEGSRQNFLDEMETFYRDNLVNGKVLRKRQLYVLYAYKE